MPPETEGTIDIEAIAARHKAPAGAGGVDGPYCMLCDQKWPCDAIRLVAYLRGVSGSSLSRWHGLCGHDWNIAPGWPNSPGPCPVCRVRKVASEMAIAVLDL